MKENALARSIVANLAHRFRFARQMANRTDDFEKLRLIYHAQAGEAWNAFQASKRILYGIEK